MDQIRIAAAQYPIELVSSFEAWERKLTHWLEEAYRAGADLAIFPEYAAMELAGIEPERAADLAASLDLVMELGQRYDAVHAALSRKFGMMILAGSRPFRREDGHIVNRAQLFGPDGQMGHQDKIVMTRFEREKWGITGGDSINVIHTSCGPIGISICYDVEFPLIARSQAEAGARLILAPSATDTMQGYWRVRIGAQARALENQCFVIQSPTVGMAHWLPCMDENFGAAGVFAPPDGNVPDNGVLELGAMGDAMWVIGEVDLTSVDSWRADGTVLPFRHWPEQTAPFRIIQNGTGAQVLTHLVDTATDMTRAHDLAELKIKADA